MCKCRSSKSYGKSKHLPYIHGKHKSLKCNFTCPMCLHIKRKFSDHDDRYDLYRFNKSSYIMNRHLECDYCHNYIREVNFLEHVVKEFFFVLDYCVIMTKDKVFLEKENCNDVILPFFIFQDEAHLMKKIQTYTLLS